MNQTKPLPYTSEFKQAAVKLAVEGEKSVAQTARDLGINENTLHTWISKYHRKPVTASTVIDPQHLYDELAELRKENKRLKEERAILKKAAAYFASETL